MGVDKGVGKEDDRIIEGDGYGVDILRWGGEQTNEPINWKVITMSKIIDEKKQVADRFTDGFTAEEQEEIDNEICRICELPYVEHDGTEQHQFVACRRRRS